VKSHKNGVIGAGFDPVPPRVTPIPVLGATDTLPLPVGNSPFSENFD
jgi:hypothetical protein